MCMCSQGGNEQSKGGISRHGSPTAPSEGQKNPPAAHQNSPSNSGKNPEVCSNYAALNRNTKAMDCYPRRPIRCNSGRECMRN
ncbi:hypothetical protein SLA2020_419520 [Shorea laevis]